MTEEQQDEVVVAVEEEQQPKPKKKRRVLVDVRAIAREGESALVEWAAPPSGLSRGFIEADKIESGKVDAEVLKAAQPYGVPWGKLVDLEKITPQAVEHELYRQGIWSAADIESRMKHAQRALLVIASKAGLTVGELHNRGKEYERNEREEGG